MPSLCWLKEIHEFFLEKLAGYLPDDKLHSLDNHFSHFSEQERKVLHGKGYYLYSYFDPFENSQETVLPLIRCWKNSLQNDDIDITEDQLDHVEKVCNTSHCANVGQNHDLYLTTDTLSLACVVEFRRVC